MRVQGGLHDAERCVSIHSQRLFHIKWRLFQTRSVLSKRLVYHTLSCVFELSPTTCYACVAARILQAVPVAFISRTLSPAERKYSASEREALACMRPLELLLIWTSLQPGDGPPGLENASNDRRHWSPTAAFAPMVRPPIPVCIRRHLLARPL